MKTRWETYERRYQTGCAKIDKAFKSVQTRRSRKTKLCQKQKRAFHKALDKKLEYAERVRAVRALEPQIAAILKTVHEGNLSKPEITALVDGLKLPYRNIVAVLPEVVAEIVAGVADGVPSPPLPIFIPVHDWDKNARDYLVDCLAGAEAGPYEPSTAHGLALRFVSLSGGVSGKAVASTIAAHRKGRLVFKSLTL